MCTIIRGWYLIACVLVVAALLATVAQAHRRPTRITHSVRGLEGPTPARTWEGAYAAGPNPV